MSTTSALVVFFLLWSNEETFEKPLAAGPWTEPRRTVVPSVLFPETPGESRDGTYGTIHSTLKSGETDTAGGDTPVEE